MAETAQQLLPRCFRSAWQRTAFVDLNGASGNAEQGTPSGRNYTFGELWCRAHALSEQWRSVGATANSVVLLRCPSGVAHPIVHLACAMTDLVVCPIPLRTPSDVVEQAIHWTEPWTIIDEPDQVMANDIAVTDGPSEHQLSRAGDQPHGIFFSSGTTGSAKGICLSRDGFFASANLYARHAGFGRGTRLLHTLPMGYMAGLVNSLFATLLAGGTVVHRQEFSPFYVGRIWQDITATDVTVLQLFPSIAGIMAQLAGKSGFDQLPQRPTLAVHSTSAPLSPTVRRRFRAAFGYGIQNCYGMTELGGPVTLQPSPVDDDSEDAGEPFEGFVVECSQTERKPGPLLLRSPHPMLGYLDGAWATWVAKPPPTFIPTHDLATYVDGVLTLHGRCDDVLNKGGIKLSSAAVERALLRHPSVENAAVIGLSEPTQGDLLVACIQTRERDRDKLKAALLALPEVTSALNGLTLDHIFWFAAFPTSHLGKTLRRELRQTVETSLLNASNEPTAPSMSRKGAMSREGAS